MTEIQTTYCKIPIGIAKIVGDKNGIHTVSILDDDAISDEKLHEETPEFLRECVLQLKEYFNGKRASFNLVVNPKGSIFQIKVWKELLKVPYGKTSNYLGQSRALGDVKAVRAVASANGKNPLLIIIPCHRIIGSDGSLTGYAGGIWRKKWLLAHENPLKQQSLF